MRPHPGRRLPRREARLTQRPTPAQIADALPDGASAHPLAQEAGRLPRAGGTFGLMLVRLLRERLGP